MRTIVGIVLLFVITVPPLIYFYLHAQDKDLAGAILAVFGGFFVDRCIDALDRHELSAKVKGITDTIERTIGRVTVEAGVAAMWRVPLATAFSYAEGRLKGANKVLNTAWSTRGHARAATSKGYEQWINAMAEAVAHDGCVIQEVVASPDRARAVTDLLAKNRKQLTGRYVVTDISHLFEKSPQLPFTEFVVFEQGNGKEVVFGWSTSSDFAANHDCFATAFPPVVAYFEAQFERLAQLGHRMEGKSAAS
jgi:hypothetical protein